MAKSVESEDIRVLKSALTNPLHEIDRRLSDITFQIARSTFRYTESEKQKLKVLKGISKNFSKLNDTLNDTMLQIEKNEKINLLLELLKSANEGILDISDEEKELIKNRIYDFTYEQCILQRRKETYAKRIIVEYAQL